jgi:hypothetical protein
VEEDPRLLAILVGGLVERLRVSGDLGELDRVLRFSMDLPGEFAVMLVKELQLAGIRVEESGAWSEWVKRHAYLLG